MGKKDMEKGDLITKEEEKNYKKPKTKIKVYNAHPILALRIIGIIIIILVVYFIGSKGTSLFKSNANVINTQFENRSEFTTQVERVTVVEDTTKDRTFFSLFSIPFTESRIIFSYDVIIKAGIDLSQVSYVSEDSKNKTITLKIPHSEIFDATVDYDSKHVYLDQNNLFSRITFDESETAVAELVGKAKEKAESSGDLTNYADENAKKVIENIIKTNKEYKDYSILYKYIDD